MPERKRGAALRGTRDVAKHFANSWKSISVRVYERLADEGKPGLKTAAIAALGITPAAAYVRRTPAQKLMIELMVARMPRGARTKEQFARGRMKKRLIEMARQGKDVRELAQFQELSPRDRRQVLKRAQLHPFADQFNRLGFVDCVKVFAVCNAAERRRVAAILVQKRRRARPRTAGRVNRPS